VSELRQISDELLEWRVLREFPDYEISNDGRLRRCTDGKRRKAGFIMKMSKSKKGYPKYMVIRRGDEKKLYRNAHRLVATEFLSEPSDGKQNVLHEDDDRLNCIYTNLKWGSVQDNSDDAIKNGRIAAGSEHASAKKPWARPRGVCHTRAKLTESNVLDIFHDKQKTASQLASEYDVDPALIWRIKKGIIWKHLTNPEYRKFLDDGRLADAKAT
jgi:hypothetical protein